MLGARLATVAPALARPDPNTKANHAVSWKLSSRPARKCGNGLSFRQLAPARRVQNRTDARRVTPIVAAALSNKGTRHEASDVQVKRIMGEGSYGQVFEVTLLALAHPCDPRMHQRLLQTCSSRHSVRASPIPEVSGFPKLSTLQQLTSTTYHCDVHAAYPCSC